jgi:hypothetical protein
VLLLLSGVAFAAQPSASQRRESARAAEQLQELGEVVVSGEKPTRRIADLIPWLRRLLGRYEFAGYVDLGGQGNPEDLLRVRGSGECVGFGVAPGVQCEIDVRWPKVTGPAGEDVIGGVSYLSPAMILYGVEPDERGIRYLQVDNRGLAEGATGLVTGDTAAFRTPCVDMAADCHRVVRITAREDSKIVDMQIDTELNYQVVTRFRFQLTRVAQLQTGPGAGPR